MRSRTLTSSLYICPGEIHVAQSASEISVWAGINGHGKSIALSHVAVGIVALGEKVCIASMEMKPRKLGRKMYQQIVGHDNSIIRKIISQDLVVPGFKILI
jgi:ABC-type enterochelin transport system ATPase subunit